MSSLSEIRVIRIDKGVNCFSNRGYEFWNLTTTSILLQFSNEVVVRRATPHDEQIRHIDDESALSDLVFTDAFSVQALGLDGAERWSTTFPNMLIQGYFAFNHSFVFIRNSRSLTAGPEVISDGVKLLPGGAPQVDNHVLLALLFSPVGTRPPLPLLSSLPAEEIDRIPAKGVTSSDVWPITKSNLSEGLPALPLLPGRPREHSFARDSVVLLAMLGYVFLFYLLYRWATWLLQRSLPARQAPSLALRPAIPAGIGAAEAAEAPQEEAPHMIRLPDGDTIPICTGLYHQDFEVAARAGRER